MVDQKRLLGFLGEYAKNKTMVPPAMALFEPFFSIAEAQNYPLAAASDALCQEAAAAITAATGLTVTEVVAISSADAPDTRTAWLTEKAYRGSIQYKYSLGNSLRDGYGRWAGLELSLSDRFGNGFWNGLGEGFWMSVPGDLWHSLQINLTGRYHVTLGDSLWYSLQISLCLTLASVVSGDEDRLERLAPLLRLLPRALPIGHAADEPGTWFVLFA